MQTLYCKKYKRETIDGFTQIALFTSNDFYGDWKLKVEVIGKDGYFLPQYYQEETVDCDFWEKVDNSTAWVKV